MACGVWRTRICVTLCRLMTCVRPRDCPVGGDENARFVRDAKSGRGFVFETSNVLFENEKRAHALRLRPRSALTMTANAPTRIPARFVRIRGLTSSTHLNGELARLGKWLPQRARWEVSVCDSRNLGPTKEVVLAIKETNVEDVDDDGIVAWIRERLADARYASAMAPPEA